ncbi:MAG: hemerythrin family protein [Syntrophomonadaceae bacterium]|jgi:hemerythrin|nr:hemerythrin family protein [Syntrophomonadaceae bacterium]
MISWRDEFALGVPEIDEQHKKLFAIANRAYEVLKNELLVDKYDQIVAIFNELKDYTVYHFTFEENYMKSIGYRKFLSHKVQHDDFIERINETDLRQIDENQEQYLIETLEFVVAWIEKHILGVDKKIVEG